MWRTLLGGAAYPDVLAVQLWLQSSAWRNGLIRSQPRKSVALLAETLFSLLLDASSERFRCTYGAQMRRNFKDALVTKRRRVAPWGVYVRSYRLAV